MMKFIREMANKNLIRFYRRACVRVAAFFCSSPFCFSFFCIWMNAFWNSTLLFTIQFLFSFLRSRLKQIHARTHTFCSWRFWFVHISSTRCCPYLVRFLSHGHNRNAILSTATAESHSFLALLCILMIKMIVGLNHRVVLVGGVDLLTNATSYYHWVYSFFILIKPYSDIDLLSFHFLRFFLPTYSIEQKSQIETFRYQKHDRRCKFSTSSDANPQNHMYTNARWTTFLLHKSGQFVYLARECCACSSGLVRFGHLLEIGL